MAVEISQGEPISEQPINNLHRSGVIFDATDPHAGELSREERIRLYYATQLADGNLAALAPRYRTPEEGSEQEPWRDVMVADPLSDPKISELASILRTTGYEQEVEDKTP